MAEKSSTVQRHILVFLVRAGALASITIICTLAAIQLSFADQEDGKQATQREKNSVGVDHRVPTIRGKGRSYSGIEYIEADVHTRSVSVTAGFSGTEIVVFGAVERGPVVQKEVPNYDVIVVVESHSSPLLVRRKSRVAGIWINTDSLLFNKVPTFYAIASTRPLNEIADERILRPNAIGLEYLTMPDVGVAPNSHAESKDSVADYRRAVIRLKKNEKLYQSQDYGVTFLGATLFRATIDLPVNVPVGPLSARVYLFRDGQLLADYSSKVLLQREGFERFVYDSAFQYPFFYGICVVLLAAGAGVAASAAFGRTPH